MASFDYDVLIVGSGFGGSVVRAPRSGEGLPGRRHGVRQAVERRRHSEEPVAPARVPVVPRSGALRHPAGGVPRRRARALAAPAWAAARTSTPTRLYVPPKQFFDAPEWASITDWADELAPRLDQATRMLGASATRTCPPTSIASCTRSPPRWAGARRSTRHRWASTSAARASRPTIRTSAASVRGAPAASRAASATSAAATTPRTSSRRTTSTWPRSSAPRSTSCTRCYDLVPLDGGGFEVHARHPGWAQRAAHLHHHTYTAEQVIVAAHAYGSSKLLLHMQHKGRLTGPLEPARAASADELRTAPGDHPDARRVEARSGADPPHTGVGVDHLRRLAGPGDEHRAGLLGRRQRPVRASWSPTTSTASRSIRPPGG